MIRRLFPVVILLVFVSLADAGPFRRGRRNYVQYEQPTQQVQPVQVASASQGPVDTSKPVASADDALDEVNAKRAASGLRPFIKDDGLTQAAQACAVFRAAHLMAGHTGNDFQFVPAGSSASAAGCAAWEPSMGWGSCCTTENWTYAGAAWCMGSNGLRFMQLFVR